MDAGAYVKKLQGLCPKLTSLCIKTTTNHSLELEAEGGVGAIINEVLSWVTTIGQSLEAKSVYTAEVVFGVLRRCLPIPIVKFGIANRVRELHLPKLPSPSVASPQLRGFMFGGGGVMSVLCPRNSSWEQLGVQVTIEMRTCQSTSTQSTILLPSRSLTFYSLGPVYVHPCMYFMTTTTIR